MANPANILDPPQAVPADSFVPVFDVNNATPRQVGYSLDEILNGNAIPQEAGEAEEREADPADLRYMQEWMKPRFTTTRWLCKEARDGNMSKKHKLAIRNENPNWGDGIREHQQLQKNDCLVAFEAMDPISFELAVWDDYPEASLGEVQWLIYLMTGAGPNSCLPSDNRSASREVWVNLHRGGIYGYPLIFPWSMENRRPTTDELKELLSGQVWGRYVRGDVGGQTAGFAANRFTLVASLERRDEAGELVEPMYWDAVDLSPDDLSWVEGSYWQHLCLPETVFHTSLGPFYLFNRFEAKYTKAILHRVMPPTPFNINPQYSKERVPFDLAWKYVPAAPKRVIHSHTVHDRRRLAAGAQAKEAVLSKTVNARNVKAKTMAKPSAKAGASLRIGAAVRNALEEPPAGPPAKAGGVAPPNAGAPEVQAKAEIPKAKADVVVAKAEVVVQGKAEAPKAKAADVPKAKAAEAKAADVAKAPPSEAKAKSGSVIETGLTGKAASKAASSDVPMTEDAD